jgi:hypothetical protein
VKKRPKSAKSVAVESFYINGKSNSKGSLITKYPNKKSVRKVIPLAAIPDKEEIVTTKEVYLIFFK